VIIGLNNAGIVKALDDVMVRRVLLLGYKKKGRGAGYYDKQIENNILTFKSLIDDNQMLILSFDNLALEQLDVKNLVSAEDYELYYMGDDGEFTFYVDLPNHKYAVSSTSDETYSFDEPMTIGAMFRRLQDKYY